MLRKRSTSGLLIVVLTVMLSCGGRQSGSAPTGSESSEVPLRRAVDPPTAVPVVELISIREGVQLIEEPLQNGVLYTFEWLVDGKFESLKPATPVPWPDIVSTEGDVALRLRTPVVPNTVRVVSYPAIAADGVPHQESRVIVDCEAASSNSTNICQFVSADNTLTLELGQLTPLDRYLAAFSSWPVSRDFQKDMGLGLDLGELPASWLFAVEPQPQ